MKNRQPTCPDPERLAEYVDGTSSLTQRKALEEHFASCSDCRHVVAETALSVDEMRGSGVTPGVWTRASSKRVTGVVGALAAAAALVVAIRVYESANDANRGTTGGSPSDPRITTTDKRLLSASPLVTDIAIEEIHASPEWKAFREILEKLGTRPVSGRLTGLPYLRGATREGGRGRTVQVLRSAAQGRSTIVAPLAEERGLLINPTVMRLSAIAETNPKFRPAAAVASLTLGSPRSTDDAIGQLTEVLRAEPASASVWNDLAVAYLAKSDLVEGARIRLALDQAVSAARRAIEINPSLSEPYFNYALALERLGEDAANAWQEALDHEIESDWANEAQSHLPVKDDRERLDEVRSPEDLRAINAVLSQYCAAYDQRDFDALRRVFPKAPAELRNEFGQYRNMKCKVVGMGFPRFRGDRRVVAQASIKNEYQLKGDPDHVFYSRNVAASLTLSRPDPNANWIIEAATLEVLPLR